VGRQEISQNPSDAYKFRSLTMRQLKDARTFLHNGSLTQLCDVVAYFNAGVPQDPTAGASPTLDTRFTNPRPGPGWSSSRTPTAEFWFRTGGSPSYFSRRSSLERHGLLPETGA
jgi:hypothetical protein